MHNSVMIDNVIWANPWDNLSINSFLTVECFAFIKINFIKCFFNNSMINYNLLFPFYLRTSMVCFKSNIQNHE